MDHFFLMHIAKIILIHSTVYILCCRYGCAPVSVLCSDIYYCIVFDYEHLPILIIVIDALIPWGIRISMLDKVGTPSGVHVKNPFVTYGRISNKNINDLCWCKTSLIFSLLKCLFRKSIDNRQQLCGVCVNLVHI